MKVRYKLIGDLLLYEDECIAYLEKMAEAGWYLVKIGLMFFKFEKREPKKIKYQIDYNVLTDEYLETLELIGYHFIDNRRNILLFYNDDMEAEDLYTDETTRLIALGSMYKYSDGFTLIGLSFLLFVLFSGIWDIYSSTIRYTLGSLVMNVDSVVFSYVLRILYLTISLDGVLIILIRLDINRQIEHKSSLKKMIKRFNLVVNLLACLSIILFIPVIIDKIIFYPIILIVIVLSIFIYAVWNKYINNVLNKESNDWIKKLKILIASVFYILLGIVVPDVDFINNNDDNIVPFQDGVNINSNSNKSLLVSTYTNNSYKGEKCIFLENKYECLTRGIADAVFEELICENERETRMPSEKEIEAIVDRVGEWSSKNIKFSDYNDALKKFKVLETKYADKCYYLDNIYVVQKDKKVLDIIKKDDVDIDDILKYYIK